MAVRYALSILLGLGLAIGAWAGDGPLSDGVVVLLPVQDRAGDRQALAAVERALSRELESRWRTVVRPGRARDVLRRLRVRSVDAASPDLLGALAAELGADWLVSATLHDADRRDVPRLTLSARAYRGETGELSWAGFRGGSGLDRRGLLDSGRIDTFQALADQIVGRLEPRPDGSRAGDRAARLPGVAAAGLGTVAVVPFSGVTDERATANAYTITEAARAALYRLGVPLVTPGCAKAVLRRQPFARPGGLDGSTREELGDSCGANSILTGSVERYEEGGAEGEPEPRVAVALRLIDAETGRILWTDASEREGWDRSGLFRLGRVYSRGALADEMMRTLTRRLVRDRARDVRRGGGTP